MNVTAPLVAIALMIAVGGAAVATPPRIRRTPLVATVGVATIALAVLFAAQLRRVDTYFNEPGRLVWDNQPGLGFRALLIVALAVTALVGALTMVRARRATVDGRITTAALVITPPIALATLFITIAFGAH